MHKDLKALEERWGLALQSASFGVWDLDPQADRVHYSAEWKALLGYGDLPDAVTEHTAFWRSLVHADDLPRMLEVLRQHLAGGSASYETEFRLRSAAGEYRWVLSRGRVVQRDAHGRALRMVGTLIDVTDSRELQAARSACERAEAANRAKNEFLSRMSHELRTPLNAVLGFAQLLSLRLGDGDIDNQRRQLGHIEQAGWHLLAMINDVLDLSRVESGELALSLGALALPALWAEVVAMLTPLAARHAVRLHDAEVPPQVRVLADPLRLKQVLSNLVSNAIKYNRPGGWVRLDVAVQGRCWRLSVSDNGIGITPAQMAHLFEPFNRLGRERSGIEGVGIGLVLTRQLVERMGGHLALRSSLEHGTTVDIDLPRADPAG